MKKGILALALVLILSSGLVFSADYKDWLPYVPETLGGKKKAGDDEAGNVSFNGITNSSLFRIYGSESDEITLMIVWDPSGRQMIATKTMLETLKQMPIETPETVYKLITVQGFPAMYSYYAETNRAAIQTLLSETVLVQLNAAGGGRNESHYINLLRPVNLKKILNNM